MNLVHNSLNHLNEIEKAYLQEKQQVKEELIKQVTEIATLSDSLASRAKNIRELYWHKGVPPKTISDAFGLSVHQMKQIAGKLTVEFLCFNMCGNKYSREFEAKAALIEYRRDIEKYKTNNNFASRISNRMLCENCKNNYKNKSEEERIRLEQAHKKRNEVLKNLTWWEYTETREFINARNYHLWDEDFQCQVCFAEPIRLAVCLQKGGIQNHNPFLYFLCETCVNRCVDLIDTEKIDYIKQEIMSGLHDWYSAEQLRRYSNL